MAQSSAVNAKQAPQEKACLNTRKTSPDVFFINESQPEVQNAEVFMGEFPYSPVQESESIENVKQPSDENAEKSAPEVLFINTFDPKVEDAETCMLELLDSHVLESTTTSHVPEPESSQSYENAEISGTIESINLQNELLVEGTEVDPIGGFESGIRINEPITTHGDTSELEKELVAETNESFPAIEEEIEKSTIAAIDVSLDSRVLESDNLIEKDEPAAELNESVHAMEEEIERSTVASIDMSLDCRVLESDTVIEKSEPAAEINETVHAVEEEIERCTTVAAIDGSLDSCVLESDTVIEKDEPAAEIEELERSAIDASSDSDVLKIDAFIEKDEQPAAETNDTVPAMEEEIERSAIDASSDSHVPKNDALNENAETTESALAMEEEIEGSGADNAGIDTSSDSHVTNSNTVKPALGDEFDDAQEMGNHQAESIPDVTIRRIESEQPTSAQAASSLQLESAESEALQEEDHQMGQIQVSVEHQGTSTGSVSVTEESVGPRSSDAAPEMPKREEE